MVVEDRQRLDRAAVDSLFPGEETVRRIPKSSTKFAKRMEKLVQKGRAAAKENGWLTEERSRAAMAFGWHPSPCWRQPPCS